jgi:hypothetical protein
MIDRILRRRVLGVKAHGRDKDAKRPRFKVVLWIGQAQPRNSEDGDIWIDTSDEG